MLDISESGRQIGEKLFAVLDEEQKTELQKYLLEEVTQFPVDSSTDAAASHPLLGYPVL